MKLTDLDILSKRLSNIPSLEIQEKMKSILIDLGYDPNHVYQELEMTSNYVDTHQDISYSNNHVQLHSHNFYELLYCRNTCGAEYLVGSQRYKLQKGDIILIPPGVSHRPILPEPLSQPYIRDILWLSQDFVDNMKHFYNHSFIDNINNYCLLRTHNTNYEYLGEYFHKGVLENEQKMYGYETIIIGNTITLLTHLIRALSDKKSIPLKAEKPELFDEITDYIENNYSNKISLSDISNKFYISESTINLLFKEKMNTSFYRYVTLRRLIEAKRLISENIPLEDVANLVGYIDYSTFYRAFKHEYGISPRKYKNM